MKFAYALTGGIATGKSSVSSLLSLAGFKIISLDKIAHQILDENYLKIGELFGDSFIENKRVLRSKLGQLIFKDKIKKEILENFIHKLIFKEAKQQAEKLDKFQFPYIMEIPLFFENNRYPIPKNRVIVVYSTKQQQLERVIKRDNLSKDDAILRIDSQININEKQKLTNLVIDNSGNLKQLQKECEKIIEKLKTIQIK